MPNSWWIKQLSKSFTLNFLSINFTFQLHFLTTILRFAKKLHAFIQVVQTLCNKMLQHASELKVDKTRWIMLLFVWLFTSFSKATLTDCILIGRTL